MMAALAADNGAAYLHVLQPNQYLAGSKRLSKDERARAFIDDWRGELITAGYRALQSESAALRERKIAFADLTMLFARHDETLYRDTCCHMNLAGNELLARAIADQVVLAPSGR
jgi:hypothetical protein